MRILHSTRVARFRKLQAGKIKLRKPKILVIKIATIHYEY